MPGEFLRQHAPSSDSEESDHESCFRTNENIETMGNASSDDHDSCSKQNRGPSSVYHVSTKDYRMPFHKAQLRKCVKVGGCKRGRKIRSAHRKKELQSLPDCCATRLCPVVDGCYAEADCKSAQSPEVRLTTHTIECHNLLQRSMAITKCTQNQFTALWHCQPPCGTATKSKRIDVHHEAKMCSFHVEGFCSRGIQCMFAHDAASPRQLPGLSFNKMCSRFLQLSKCEVYGCKYAHRASQWTTGMEQTAKQSCYEEDAWRLFLKNTFLSVRVAPPALRRCCSTPSFMA